MIVNDVTTMAMTSPVGNGAFEAEEEEDQVKELSRPGQHLPFSLSIYPFSLHLSHSLSLTFSFSVPLSLKYCLSLSLSL